MTQKQAILAELQGLKVFKQMYWDRRQDSVAIVRVFRNQYIEDRIIELEKEKEKLLREEVCQLSLYYIWGKDDQFWGDKMGLWYQSEEEEEVEKEEKERILQEIFVDGKVENCVQFGRTDLRWEEYDNRITALKEFVEMVKEQRPEMEILYDHVQELYEFKRVQEELPESVYIQDWEERDGIFRN